MREFLAGLCLLGGLVASGCSSNWKRELLYSKSGVALYREYEWDGQRKKPLDYRHPVLIDAQKTALIMNQLTWRSTYFLDFKKPRDLQVFNPQEVGDTAKAMSLALGTIESNERLRFLVTRSNWSEAFLGTQATSGVMFCVKEGILEVAFDRIQDRLADGEGGDPMEITFHDPLEITDADPILPAPAVTPHIDPLTGIDHPRWVDVQLDQLRAVASTPPASPPAAGSPAPATASTSPAVAPGSPQTAPGSDPYQRVRDRIEGLKRLRADGAITEEEYTREFEKAISEL